MRCAHVIWCTISLNIISYARVLLCFNRCGTRYIYNEHIFLLISDYILPIIIVMQISKKFNNAPRLARRASYRSFVFCEMYTRIPPRSSYQIFLSCCWCTWCNACFGYATPTIVRIKNMYTQRSLYGFKSCALRGDRLPWAICSVRLFGLVERRLLGHRCE